MHLAVFVVAAVVGLTVWTKDKKPKANLGDVVVWQGRSADVERVVYVDKKRKVELVAKSDKAGRYFEGKLERLAAVPGAPDGDVKTIAFVSVGSAEKLAEGLGQLRAFRALGRVPDTRLEEFGLHEEAGTLEVTVAGKVRKLTLGGSTSGGGDRYVKLADTGEAFAIEGDLVRDLENAEVRLVERDLHEWKENEVSSAKLVAGARSRDVVRGGAVEGKRFWADAGSPEQQDETIGNTMAKLDKLRPTEFAAEAPPGAEVVLRVDYAQGSKPLGYLELSRVPGEGKPSYYVTTERLRRWGKIPSQLGEQVEQDVGTLLR